MTCLPSASTSKTGSLVSRSKPCVPTGTRTTRSGPPLPYWSLPRPFSPLSATTRRENATSTSVSFPSSPTKTTSPPLPPSPPEGPPWGAYLSRRKATQPLPPDPATISTSHESTNFTEYPLLDAIVPYPRRRGGDRTLVLALRNLRLALCPDLLHVAVGEHVHRDLAAKDGAVLGRHRAGMRILRELQVDEAVEQLLALRRRRHAGLLAGRARKGQHDARRHRDLHAPWISDAQGARPKQIGQLRALLGLEERVDASERPHDRRLNELVALDPLACGRLDLGLVERLGSHGLGQRRGGPAVIDCRLGALRLQLAEDGREFGHLGVLEVELEGQESQRPAHAKAASSHVVAPSAGGFEVPAVPVSVPPRLAA